MQEKEEIRCYKCDSDYEEEYYKYQDKIYCFNCLEKELEENEDMHIVKTKRYFYEDWGELGTDDEMEEVIQNICERYEVERVE